MGRKHYLPQDDGPQDDDYSDGPPFLYDRKRRRDPPKLQPGTIGGDGTCNRCGAKIEWIHTGVRWRSYEPGEGVKLHVCQLPDDAPNLDEPLA